MSDRQPILDAEIHLINLEGACNALILMELGDAQAASAVNVLTSVMDDACKALRKTLALEDKGHG